MGLGVVKRNEPPGAPPSIFNSRLYLCAASAAMGAMVIGYDSAFLGGTLALPWFRSEFGFDQMSRGQGGILEANIICLYQAGAFIGAFVAYPLGHFCGRRFGIITAIIIFIIGAATMMFGNSQTGLSPVYAGRLFTGLGIGIVSNLIPIYIAEISVPEIRGRLLGLYELGWQLGGIVGFWINYGIAQNSSIHGKTQYLIPFGVQLIPAVICLLGLVFIMKESPRWLLSIGKREHAMKNLIWLRKLDRDHIYLINEFAMIERSLEENYDSVQEVFWSSFNALLGDPRLRNRLVIAFSLFAFQNGTGINAINYYSPKIFESIGMKGTSATLLSTGVFGVIKAITTLVWLIFIADRVDRKLMLILGAFFGGSMMYGLGAYIAIEKPLPNQKETIGASGRGALVMFYLWTFFYTPTWNPTPWVWAAEAFPVHVRSLSQAFVAASNWVFSFLIVRFTPQIFDKMGCGVYLFFGSLMMISMPYVAIVVPELRGIPLESIDKKFQEFHHSSLRRRLLLYKPKSTNKKRNTIEG